MLASLYPRSSLSHNHSARAERNRQFLTQSAAIKQQHFQAQQPPVNDSDLLITRLPCIERWIEHLRRLGVIYSVPKAVCTRLQYYQPRCNAANISVAAPDNSRKSSSPSLPGSLLSFHLDYQLTVGNTFCMCPAPVYHLVLSVWLPLPPDKLLSTAARDQMRRPQSTQSR